MKNNMIYGKEATLEELYELNETKGYEFVIEDGRVTHVLY